MFAWRVFQHIVPCIRLWYQLSFHSRSLGFYLCLFLFVIGVSGQFGQRTGVKLSISDLQFFSFTPHSYFSFHAPCSTASKQLLYGWHNKPGKESASEEILKVAQSHFISSNTKYLPCFQDSEISLIPGCSNTPSGYSELCQRSVLLLQCQQLLFIISYNTWNQEHPTKLLSSRFEVNKRKYFSHST